MKIISIIIIYMAFFLYSCEKLLIAPNPENTIKNNFELLWNEIDQGYVYFDFKKINWDSIKAVYTSQINDFTTDDELFKICANMLETLKDGHVTIRQGIQNVRTYDYTEGYEDNFNKAFVIENYLVPNDMDTTTFIRHCFLTDDIGYLYYSTFTNEISVNGIESIIKRYENTRGLILDVRGNLGGDASNINRLMEHFVTETTLVGYRQEKSGPNHQDLSAKKEIRISPKGMLYSKPIIVLANRQCYSACNAFVAYMSILPNVIVLGDRTGGGGGFPVSGQLANGWFFTYSATIGTLPNGQIIEDGIEPDISVATNQSFEIIGLDNIIEKAIIELE